MRWVNYTDREVPWTRIIEHKHFEFGTQEKTVISREYSSEWKVGDEPYYPVNDDRNSRLYEAYAALAAGEEKVLFGGRLGSYQYYDMDKVIAAALALGRPGVWVGFQASFTDLSQIEHKYRVDYSHRNERYERSLNYGKPV